MKTLPERKDVPVENTWALEDIFPTDDAWRSAMAELEGMIPDIEKYAGRLGKSGEELKSWFDLEETLSLKADAVVNYAFRLADTDNANGAWQAMRGSASALMVKLGSAMSFASPEIMAIPDDTMESFYKTCPGLEKYRRALERERLLREHILSPKEEKLLAMAGEMSESPDNIGNMLRDADMTFPNAVDSAGQEHLLTQGTYGLLVQSRDRELRKSAFKNLYAEYGKFNNTLAAVLNAQMKQLSFFAEARKYPDMLTASLAPNEVPVKVYKNLLTTVEENLAPMYRYMAVRKKALGVSELHMYDVYVPIVESADFNVSFDEAKEIILTALKPLGEDYLAVVRRALRERWIDVYENRGKTSGAYSAGARPHPYILLNHREDLDSVFTLVHEMGHAMHSYLSAANQSVIYSDYVIFVAEVASICNEVLLMHHLLDAEQDKKRRAYLINHFLEQFRTTLYRQTMFARFELMMGEMTENGETLTGETLNEKYMALNRLYYGENVVSDEEIALEWSRIPHFFYDYYVFQYATGFAAAIAIAERILKEGESAAKDYLRFLSSGSSSDPIALLKIAGVDMASPKPVKEALDYFDSLVTELEELLSGGC